LDPLALAAALATLLAIFFLLVGFGTRRPGRTENIAQRLQSLQQGAEASIDQLGEEPLLRHRRSYSGLPGLSALLSKFRGSERVALHLERAGIPLRVGEYYMIRWLLALLFS